METKRKLSESAIQASCVKWLWNTHPETRGLFFSVRNEDDGVSITQVLGVLREIIAAPFKAASIAKRFMSEIQAKKARRGGLFNAMGRVRGVSDTILLWNGKTYLIEFKDAKGRPSKDQLHWSTKTMQAGFKYFLIRDLCSFQELIHNILEFR